MTDGRRQVARRAHGRVAGGGVASALVSLRRDGVLSLKLERQHLAAGTAGEDVLRVLDDLLGCHATVPLSPYLQLRARMRDFMPAQLDGLLDEGRAARLGCMRRTLFIESAELIPLVFAATRELTARGRDRFLRASGLTVRRYEQMAKRVDAQLAGGALSARQLREALAAGESLSPVIIVMCDQGRLVRWRGNDGWQSAQPTYRRFAEALPAVRLDSCEGGTAVRELVDRYVRRYGPVSEGDISWWTGFPKATVRRAVASLPNLVSVGIERSEGAFLLDEGDVPAAQRIAAPSVEDVSLLPVLDPYLQGYRDRQRCVDPRHLPFVVDRGGNTTSVILVAGRAAGVWDFVAEPTPELAVCFFHSTDAVSRARVHAIAIELAAFLARAPARVVEVDHMTPLTEGSAGAFLSPLKDRQSAAAAR